MSAPARARRERGGTCFRRTRSSTCSSGTSPAPGGAEMGRTSRGPAKLLFRAAPAPAGLDPQSERRSQAAQRGRCARVRRHRGPSQGRTPHQSGNCPCRHEERFRQPAVVLAREPRTRHGLATTSHSGRKGRRRFALLACTARMGRRRRAASEGDGNPRRGRDGQRRQRCDPAHHALHCAARTVRRQPQRHLSAQPSKPAVRPPSIEIVWPVTYRAGSPQRKTTSGANSAGVAARFIGTAATAAATFAGVS